MMPAMSSFSWKGIKKKEKAPAAESGMKPGDIVLQIGRTKVHEPEDILDASFFLTAGDVVPKDGRANEKRDGRA